jgi:hypothetical protein
MSTLPEKSKFVGLNDSDPVPPSEFRAAMGALYDWLMTSRAPIELWSGDKDLVFITDLDGYADMNEDISPGLYFIEYKGYDAKVFETCLSISKPDVRSAISIHDGTAQRVLIWDSLGYTQVGPAKLFFVMGGLNLLKISYLPF